MTSLTVETMMDLSGMVILYSALSSIVFTIICVLTKNYLAKSSFNPTKDKILIPVCLITLCLSRFASLLFVGSVFVYVFFLISSWL